MDRPVTRRDWWLGVAIVAATVLVHALFPRYEWLLLREKTADVLRVDGWTGRSGRRERRRRSGG